MRRPGALFAILACAVVAVLASPPAGADEARIPIYQQTTISEPGHYILTRDISVSSGVVITIHANDVTLDLNGHVLSSTSTTDDVIGIDDGFSNLSILNGTLSGGRRGISYESLSSAYIRARVESVKVFDSFDTGIEFSPSIGTDIIRCLVQNPGTGGAVESAAIYAPSGLNSPSGRIVDNQIVLTSGNVYGIVVGVWAGEVSGNSIGVLGTGIASNYPAIWVAGRGGVVEGNHIAGATWGGGAIEVSSTQTRVVDNEIQGVANNSIGIRVDGSDNLIGGNVISAGGIGISIMTNSLRNLIDGNVVQGEGVCGLDLGTSSTALTMYRNNALRGNATAVCGAAYGFNAGGNICDTGFCP